MMAWGLQHDGRTRWSESRSPIPSASSTRRTGFGLNYGVTISCGPIASRTIVGLARADREFTDAEIEEIRDARPRICTT